MVAQCLIFRAVLLNDLPQMNLPEQLGPCSLLQTMGLTLQKNCLGLLLARKTTQNTQPHFSTFSWRERSGYGKGKLSISPSDCREKRKRGQRYRF